MRTFSRFTELPSTITTQPKSPVTTRRQARRDASPTMLVGLLVARASTPCRSNSVICATQWKTISPCLDGRAAALAKEETPATEEPTHWVVVDRVQSTEDAFMSALAVGAPEPTVLVGAPAAVGRLRPERALVDKLLQTIVKEEPECAVAVGHCVDSLLLAWLQHLQAQEGSTEQQFEGLRAAAQSHTAPVLEQRGFAEIERPDMSALGRGEPIATHNARLPAGIIAYEALLGAAETIAETTRYNEILEALRTQPPPTGVALEPPSSGTPFVKEDPWARPGGIF